MQGCKTAFFTLLSVFFLQVGVFAGMPNFLAEDRLEIEELFSFLILDEGFAFVLYGSKPMSTTAFDKTIKPTCPEMSRHPMFKLESSWKIWEKYSYKFPENNFVFLAQDSDRWFQIFLINKLSALDIIKANLPLFREKLGNSLSAEQILDNVLASRDLFEEGLKGSQALYGLLLGYGRENAVGFERHFSKNRKTHRPPPRGSMEIVPFETEELMVPCFSSFSNKETYVLLKKYTKERARILEVYSKANVLEITLNRLMSSSI